MAAAGCLASPRREGHEHLPRRAHITPHRRERRAGTPLGAGRLGSGRCVRAAPRGARPVRELEEALQYLLSKRDADPYQEVLPRVAVEASWNWDRQVPTFRP